ncbi:MAG: XisH family protein [Pyrinomonadaceae bacterium]
MAAKDSLHSQVRNALVKDGWTITDDPFVIEYEGIRLKADLGAEKIFAAEKNERKIVVEIKIFGGLSFFYELHNATGQYCNYRVLLSETNPEREIWLAVPLRIYQSDFQKKATQKIIADLEIKILVYEPEKEVITEWIK